MDDTLYAAIDLGGTKIYTVLANGDGVILASEREETPASAGPGTILDLMAVSVKRIVKKFGPRNAKLRGLGVCAAGFFDWQKRVLIHSPNLAGWDNVALEAELSRRTGLPVVAENDANAAALGEARRGAGRGSSNLVFITVSTGIGAGLILDGTIYRGARGFAGEIGHMVVKPDGPLCGCGRRGCLETVASGSAIARAAALALPTNTRTLFAEVPAASGGQPNTAQVFAAARLGNKTAQSIIDEAIHYLGIGLVNLVNLLNPEVIVVGGGVAEAGETLLAPLRQAIAAKAIPPAAASVTLKKAELGVEAGVVGMLCLMTEINGRRG